jgi:hypothetical protein
LLSSSSSSGEGGIFTPLSLQLLQFGNQFLRAALEGTPVPHKNHSPDSSRHQRTPFLRDEDLHMIAQHQFLRMGIEIDLITNVPDVKDPDVVLD